MLSNPDKPHTLLGNLGATMNIFSPSAAPEKYTGQDFAKWQRAQTDAVRNRGASGDEAKEYAYLNRMLKSVQRAYMCHREVDAYATCLVQNHVVAEDELHKATVNMKAANERCGALVRSYQKCMERREYNEIIVEAATSHVNCEDMKTDLHVCLEKFDDPEAQEAQCLSKYYALLRCGFNNMYEDYWKRVSGFGTSEELHLFENERDFQKSQAVQTMKERYGG